MKLEEIGFYTLSEQRAKNASATSQMKRCEMIIIEACNFKCPYCRGLADEVYGERVMKQLSLSEVCNNIDMWCENEPLENIRFSGGEPTLHRNIVEIVQYAKSKGINRIAISTNGSNKRELYEELLNAGVNDFSVSLDACCAEDGDKMAGGIKGAWDKVVSNIKFLSTKSYVTVGVVLTPQNVQRMVDTIEFADTLGVSDIRIISASQWNDPLPDLLKVKTEVREKYPILNYRIGNLASGKTMRGITESNSHRCGLMHDDSVIAGDYHFPCIIYMREQGSPIGKVSPNMRQERVEWARTHDTFEDNICKNNCLDVCVSYNDRYEYYHNNK